jgi:hypothetical protein
MCFNVWSSVSVRQEMSTPTAHVNAGRPWTVRPSSNEDAIIAALEREPWRCRTRIGTIRTEGPQSTSWRSVASIHTTTPEVHTCFQTIVLYRCNFESDYISTLRKSSFYITFLEQTKHVLIVRVRWTSTTVTAGHGIILMLSVNVGIKTASAFGPESSATLSWAPVCYPTGRLMNDIVIFWKVYRGCLKMCLQLCGRGWGFSTNTCCSGVDRVHLVRRPLLAYCTSPGW